MGARHGVVGLLLCVAVAGCASEVAPAGGAGADAMAGRTSDTSVVAQADTTRTASPSPVAAGDVRLDACAGRCGVYAYEARCQCDPGCAEYGDCCTDYGTACGAPPPAVEPPAGASATNCIGRCGLFDAAAQCQCDTGCVSFGDCCQDYLTTCVGLSAPLCGGPCPAGAFCEPEAGPGGQCVVPTCALPSQFAGGVQRVSKLSLLSPSNGCDLDDDGKANNVLGKLIDLYKATNKDLQGALDADDLVMLWHVPVWPPADTVIDVLRGTPVAAVPGAYAVEPASWNLATAGDGPCAVKQLLQGAAIENGKLVAGGVSSSVDLPLRLAGLQLSLPVRQAALVGVVDAAAATWTKTTKGRICGVILKKDLVAAIDALPDELLAEIGDKVTVQSLIAGILKPDIDTNQDGSKDAISVALAVETTAVTVQSQP